MVLRPMSKLQNRFHPLTVLEQRHLVDEAIPNRVSLVERCVREAPTFERLTTAAIHARALAGFLGIGADRTTLWADRRYHDHGSSESYEVKVSDIKNGALFTQAGLDALPPVDREALRVGFDTINREFAHLTFWSDPANQQPHGAPSDNYIHDLANRVSRFAQTVVRLLDQRLKGL
jgi:hypothetical protein